MVITAELEMDKLKDLLHASDEAFNGHIKAFDMQSLLELATALQAEMHAEQRRFEAASSELSGLDSGADHTSAEFMRVSGELTRSQNRLAQLLARSDRCLSLQLGGKVDDDNISMRANHGLQSDPANTGAKLEGKTTVMAAAPAAHGVRSVIVKVTRKVIPLASQTPTSSSLLPHTEEGSTSRSPPSFRITKKVAETSLPPEDVTTTRVDPQKQQAIASFQDLVATFAVQPPLASSRSILDGAVSVVGSNRVTSGGDINAAMRLEQAKKSVDPSASMTTYRSQTDAGVISKITRVVTHRRIVQTSTATKSINAVDAAGNTSAMPVHRDPVSPLVPLCNTDDGCDSRRQNVTGKQEDDATVDSISASTEVAFAATDPVTDAAGLKTNPQSILQDDSEDTTKHVDKASSKSICTMESSTGGHTGKDELVQERVTVKDWNPAKLLSRLYAINLAQEAAAHDVASEVVTRTGYLEHLPIGKKKMTLLKTWRRSYFKAENGTLYLYDSQDSETARSFLPLMDGTIESSGGQTLFIDNSRGLFAMLRCHDDNDLREWQRCLDSQTRYSSRALYLRPMLSAAPNATRKIVVIDLGRCSVRAGIVGVQPSLPQLFFPAVAVRHPSSGRYVYGCDAYCPANRQLGKLIRIAGNRQDLNGSFDVEVLSGLFKEVIRKLDISISEYTVLVSLPHVLGPSTREAIARLLIEQLGAGSVSLLSQGLLALYLYGITSGIVVNIGDGLDIVTVTEGYLVNGPGGSAHMEGIGQRVDDALNAHLTSYALYSPAEALLLRYIKEQACYIASDTRKESVKAESVLQVTVDLSGFDVPPARNIGSVTVSSGRFLAAESILRPGRDISTDDSNDAEEGDSGSVLSVRLSHTIARAVLSCPVDARRAAWRGVCLVGGTSLLPGLEHRLQAELSALAPPGIVAQVHASAHRYHAAYIGACWLARLPGFGGTCVTRDEWRAAIGAAAPAEATSRASAGRLSALLSAKWSGCFSA